MPRSSEGEVIVIVSKRIDTNEVGFWEPMEKMSIETFVQLCQRKQRLSPWMRSL